MEPIDIKRLARNEITERKVEKAIETIRQVERLGGKRAEYNLASPFSRRPLTRGNPSSVPADPRAVKLSLRRR